MRVVGWSVGLLLVAGTAEAAEPRKPSSPWLPPGSQPYLRLETDATLTPGRWPTPAVGGEVAIAAGAPQLHGRFAAGAAATAPFRLANAGRVGTILETADVRLCSAAHRGAHRLRLCGGVAAGVMHLRWSGFARDGARQLPSVQAVGGGDYALALGSMLDVHAGVSFGAPMVGQQLVVRGESGAVGLRSGSVTTTFRVGIGLRLGERGA